MALQVAYLVNQYPSVSHTFIRREILALERQGVHVHRFSLRGWDLPLVDPSDIRERSLTRYVLDGGVGRLFRHALQICLRAPIRFAKAARLAWRMSRSSERGFLIHLAYLAEACVLYSWAKQTSTTHIHAHFASNPAEIVMLAHALGGPTYSFTAHGSDIMDRPAQMGLEQTVSGAAFAVAVCSFGRSQIFKWVPYALWRKVEVVRCGLDGDYGVDSTAPSGAVSRLVCVGRLSKEKGHFLLLDALAQLASRGVRPELVLAGDGPLRADIEAMAQQLGLADRVRITGWLDADGIQREIRDARALVLTSLSEGLPVVVMEAMANGRPVVAPYLAGIPELVTQGRTGWLFPAGDVRLLAAAVSDCLDTDEHDLRAMGAAARKAVRDAHDVDLEAAKLAKLFARATRGTDEIANDILAVDWQRSRS